MAAPMVKRSSLIINNIFSNYIRKNISKCKRSISFSRVNGGENTSQTHFGYENIPEDEKEERVYKVFENVATKYDLMNDAMSAGIHRLWKDYFISKMAPTPGTQLVDVAGGTGDIAFRFLNYVRNEDSESYNNQDRQSDVETPPELRSISESDEISESGESKTEKAKSFVTICDINQAMLDVGKSKAENLGFSSETCFIQGNAENLPLESNKYDVYTIAYGIRNCTHIDKVLQEAYRVLKPGGRFMCLEFSHVTNPLIQQLYDSYSFQVIPVMGQVLAQDWKSYQYLVESIRQFPKQEEFVEMIRNAGFKMAKYENITFGVTAIHSGFKI
ncbi:hypothetical protein SNE40_006731 [Patella caerulea]|uniref:2-methoxy-6-polyprenyl-1,4-benzoquinol methylase, mitochondrial n=1 Tax=Patella caerulea TaxID=87958 RepID=A0AAN8JWA8_PATCE